MKWVNKGHEYDCVYETITKKEGFYLFGAGDIGTQFYQMFKDEIKIYGFIDNHKEGIEIKSGLQIYRLADIPIKDDLGIILTAGQFQRLSIREELENKGLRENLSYFIVEEFMSVYYVYRYNKIYFSAISYLPSTACNLNCEACLNFNPFAKKSYIRTLEQIKTDFDLFFTHVDKVMIFHISGGEPMLYPKIGEVIQYIDEKYHDKIHTLRTVTNGTIIPSDSILEVLSGCKVEVTVDDYREAVPHYSDNFNHLLRKLKEYGINHYINKVNNWIDLAPSQTNNYDWSEKQLINHFDTCGRAWNEFREGKLFSCNYDGYATVAGINELQKEEIYDLRDHTQDKNKELVEFRLGYNEKGYTNLCKHCRGFHPDNAINVPVARQTK